MLSVRIDGMKELQRKFDEAPDVVAREIRDALRKSAVEVERNVVRELNNKGINNTGKLAQSVTIEEGKLSIKVYARANYAGAIEYGTPPHYVSPNVLKDWARKKLGNESLAYVVSRKIKQRGTRPRNFFYDGTKLSLDAISNNFKYLINNIFG